MKIKKGVASLVVVAALGITLTGCESLNRTVKSVSSDIGGGLNRTVKVLSYDGKIIKEYKGKFDIQVKDRRVLFDLNGKRISIYNSPLIVEEN